MQPTSKHHPSKCSSTFTNRSLRKSSHFGSVPKSSSHSKSGRTYRSRTKSVSKSRSRSRSFFNSSSPSGSGHESTSDSRSMHKSRSCSRSRLKSRSRSRSVLKSPFHVGPGHAFRSRSRSLRKSRSRTKSLRQSPSHSGRGHKSPSNPDSVLKSHCHAKSLHTPEPYGPYELFYETINKEQVGKIYLGDGISTTVVNWELLKESRDSNAFLCDLARTIWGKKLKNICLDYTKVKNSIPGKGPVQLANPTRLELYLSKLR
ncbi:hypothetical protein TKK_0003504 [Trichogramma kaykai]